MKIIQSSFFRAIVAAIVGALLVKYRDQAVEKITIAIGALFLISGIVSVVSYVQQSKHSNDIQLFDADGRQLLGQKPVFPIVGIGSGALGIILMLMPSTFIKGLMYCFAFIVIIGAIGQFASLTAARRYARIGLFYWIMPSLLLLTGLITVIYPQAIASAPLFVLGWCLLVYAVVETLNALKIYSCRKKYMRNYTEIKSPSDNTSEQSDTEAKK